METINSVAAAAAKAVWGEDTANKEPVSGAQGNVSKGEPYDAGNLEPARQEQVEHSLQGQQSESSAIPKNSETTFLPLQSESSALPHRGTTTTSQHFENTSVPQSSLHDTTSEQIDTRDPERIPQNTSKLHDVDTTTPGPASKPSGGLDSFNSRPSEGLDSSSHGNLTTARDGNLGQGIDSKPLESKSLESKSLETKPLESTHSTSKPSGSLPAETKPLGSSEKKPESEGTGQEYVKTTGFAADGGDFDATKPGAGREADRLLEEKGEHHGEIGDSHNHGSSGKDKPSLGERIKAKLHKH
ncbi:hypothetical protein AK830_g309 [Neonectria ditissima]|uniref:Uncharacterized protein n=1 Tax=Neonectria ditissima TaxID=78410 RepID=A0A0P7B7M3_9HYPO|nr:hypothetical protein AK830_g309 [Neonectria ditissima]